MDALPPERSTADERQERCRRATEAIESWNHEHPEEEARLGELLQEGLSADRGIHFRDEAELERWLVEAATTPWTDDLNARRCLLIDRELTGELTPAEKAELDQLQERMLRHRDQLVPLPLDAARQLHAELLARAGQPPRNK